MSLANKILVGVIAFVAIAFLGLAVVTLRMHQNWSQLYTKYEERIAQLQKDSQAQIDGTPDRPGIRQLRVEIARLTADRGRVWFKCDTKVAAKPEAGTATVTVTTEQPDLASIAANTILYAFEETEAQKRGAYLGQFKVTKSHAAQKQVVIVPTYRWDAADIERLAKAQHPWVLYDAMPRDNRDLLSRLSDEEKKALQLDSARPVRDYQVLLSRYHAQKMVLNDRIDSTTRDNQQLQEALASGKQLVGALAGDVTAAKQDATKLQGQRDVVAAYLKLIEQEFEATTAAITKFIHENQAMAGQLAALQREAVRHIDQRTRAMARNGAGGQ